MGRTEAKIKLRDLNLTSNQAYIDYIIIHSFCSDYYFQSTFKTLRFTKR